MIQKYFIFFINTLNQYSNLILVLLGIVGFIYVREEYVLKIRPFVTVEIAVSKNDGRWNFNLILVNKGQYPGKAKITNALLKIGDEKYPTVFDSDLYLAPNEKQKIAPIGHINEVGRKRIMGNQYKVNRVEIVVDIESGFITDKKLKYETHCAYNVDVSGEEPVFSIISEKLI